MTVKRNLTPDERARIARILRELRADVRELRSIFERLHERLEPDRR
jgi:hypothetical protein